MNTDLTIIHMHKAWLQAHADGNANTYKTTDKNFTGRIIPYFEEVGVKNVVDLNVDTVLDFCDEIKYGESPVTGKVMSGAGAGALFSSLSRVLTWAKNEGLIAENVCEVIKKDYPEAIPRADKKAQKDSHLHLTKEELRTLVNAMLNTAPVYGDLKSVAYYMISIPQKYRVVKMQGLTWDDVDALKTEGKISELACKIIDSYEAAQEIYLQKAKITNSKGLVFVKNANPGTDGARFDRNVFRSFLKAKLKENKLPDIDMDSLHDMEASVYDVMQELDADKDYAILGDVTITEPSAFGCCVARSPEEKAAMKAKEEERKAKYLAKQKAKLAVV